MPLVPSVTESAAIVRFGTVVLCVPVLSVEEALPAEDPVASVFHFVAAADHVSVEPDAAETVVKATAPLFAVKSPKAAPETDSEKTTVMELSDAVAAETMTGLAASPISFADWVIEAFVSSVTLPNVP